MSLFGRLEVGGGAPSEFRLQDQTVSQHNHYQTRGRILLTVFRVAPGLAVAPENAAIWGTEKRRTVTSPKVSQESFYSF